MKRLLFLFIAIVFLSGCDTQTYLSNDIINSTSMYTTQVTSKTAKTPQTIEQIQPSTEAITKRETTSESDTKEITVYITKTGEKYHKDGCRYLSKSKIPIDLSVAIAAGYDACSVCDPPMLETEPKVTKSTQEQAEKEEITVYITKTGSKYHSAGCRYLSKSSIPISLSDAKDSYSPCSVCDPPR